MNSNEAYKYIKRYYPHLFRQIVYIATVVNMSNQDKLALAARVEQDVMVLVADTLNDLNTSNQER